MDFNASYINAKRKAAEFLKTRQKSGIGEKQRIPPGQRVVSKMVAMPPIVPQYPHLAQEFWTLKVYGEVENEVTWNWEAFNRLPLKDYVVDFHCVTSWSKLDQKFSGVPFLEIVKLVKPKPSGKFVVFGCAEGYTTNLVYKELLENPAFVAIKMDDLPIEDKYGGPVRAVVPHLYGWKSAKHLTSIHFQAEDEPGFWEVRGYHNHADPWKEERYS